MDLTLGVGLPAQTRKRLAALGETLANHLSDPPDSFEELGVEGDFTPSEAAYLLLAVRGHIRLRLTTPS